jgi:hypothetical protein
MTNVGIITPDYIDIGLYPVGRANQRTYTFSWDSLDSWSSVSNVDFKVTVCGAELLKL